MYKKFLAVTLFSAMAISMLTSCFQQGTMEKPFFEEEITKYSPLVENSALTIYVDVNAENSGDGSESSPFKTIQEAQAKIREIKAGQKIAQLVVVPFLGVEFDEVEELSETVRGVGGFGSTGK